MSLGTLDRTPPPFFRQGPSALTKLTFIVGSLLWATRRMSRTLLLPMFLHGFWDSSIFGSSSARMCPCLPS